MLNTANDGWIDTLAAKQNISNTLVDSMYFYENRTHTIPVNSIVDSIQVILYYPDTSRMTIEQRRLVDTVSIGGIRNLNMERKTFYNVSSDINIDIDYLGGDTIFYISNWVRYKEIQGKVILLPNDSVKVVSGDSLSTYYQMPQLGNCNYGHKMFELEIYNHYAEWQYDSIIAIQSFSYQTDTLHHDDIYGIYNIGDTIDLTVCRDSIRIDTAQKKVRYALAWRYYKNNINLPVELSYFKAEQVKNSILLTWQTDSELDNYGFYIERSSDGINWTRIGFEIGVGFSLDTITYYFTDDKPLKGKNYYRLVQTDLDGTQATSDIESVYYQNVLKVYPNPASGKIFVAKPSEIIIYNMLGEAVKHEKIINQMDVSGLKGQFVVEVITDSKTNVFVFVFFFNSPIA